MNPAIQKSISIVGSQAKLALKVGVGQPTVSKWLNGADIGSRYISAISHATAGQVSEKELLQSVAESDRSSHQACA
ncbi:helix-turn-helix domain-containing protein [Rouxiella badensis]|nr:helix-turn-helix domain-containing protein [Rouxiella badensis]MCC3730394.1 helix-turn-helix domain-containing protein [Rouxiella badensis]WAT06465.1 YdaS family helix-turn-helix protein [Rouxiella badensis]